MYYIALLPFICPTAKYPLPTSKYHTYLRRALPPANDACAREMGLSFSPGSDSSSYYCSSSRTTASLLLLRQQHYRSSSIAASQQTTCQLAVSAQNTASTGRVTRTVPVYAQYLQGPSLRGRPTPPATLVQEGKVRQTTMQSGQRSVIEYSFFMIDRITTVANWRLDIAKSPAAMLQEKTARTPCTLRFAGGCRTYVALNARSHAVRTYIPEVG